MVEFDQNEGLVERSEEPPHDKWKSKIQERKRKEESHYVGNESSGVYTSSGLATTTGTNMNTPLQSSCLTLSDPEVPPALPCSS